MAAVPVTIDGVLCDKYGRTIQVVRLMGDMVRSDVGVGGGPIYPPTGDGKPPFDPSLHPEHPIVIPPAPIEPPPDQSVGKPPPPGGGWGWHPDYGWGYFPGTGPVPGPKA